MAWIRGVVAYELSEHDPGVVAVSRGAGSFVGPLTLASSLLTVFLIPGNPLFAVLSMPWVGRLCVFCK